MCVSTAESQTPLCHLVPSPSPLRQGLELGPQAFFSTFKGCSFHVPLLHPLGFSLLLISQFFVGLIPYYSEQFFVLYVAFQITLQLVLLD